ncbi:wHTH domain-containing protein [Pseudonocardia charpentierae]|uniref:Caspase domain-containing protein n=1 Tax=Pseudonocardia charpentierae TaxID=3075545 RepID=A0ABU2NI37_9PSEU|nr:caspase family protein [Pseudonocardia sp. DSM 45834]MDT0353631.1 hypothetical protein [Pseudonocardia sp. DSM 45834]
MAKPPRRALLVGVPRYDDSAIDQLPFIVDDIADLSKTLTAVGYEVQVHPPDQTDRDRIDNTIEQFCRNALPQQQLLIFLSGHGIHRNGHDYLVPSSADTASRKFAERCLEIDFDGHIEDGRSRCGDVLVVVDACREGVKLEEKGSYLRGWSEQERGRAASRTIAYLYACSSGEMARWKETPDGTYSLFTRVFSRVIADSSAPGTLIELRDEVQCRLEDLSATLGVPFQRPLLKGDSGQGSKFVVVDRPVDRRNSSGASSWAQMSREHVAWEFTRPGDNPGDGPLPESARAVRDAVVEVVATWSEGYRALRSQLPDDPWWDGEMATRIHARLTWIMRHLLNRGKLVESSRAPLSSAEAATLVLVPLAQQLHLVSCAVRLKHVVEVQDGDLTRREDQDTLNFERYVETQGRVYRHLKRLEAGNDKQHIRVVRWWLFHRWLVRIPTLYQPDYVADCVLRDLGTPASQSGLLLSELFSAERVARLLRALRSDPEVAATPEVSVDAVAGAQFPTGVRTVAGGSPDEQSVRDGLIALLLVVAEEFTMNATALPGVLVEHVGLTGGVEAAEVVHTVRTARWTARGRTRVLEAECSHQAVQLALTEHAAGIAEVLRRIDAFAEGDKTLEALRDLPTHVAADRLRPLLDGQGHPRYEGIGFRFRLDDDRVQELLMGEQLYGDPALAIRELYQNALDACRYRRARTQYLERRGHVTRAWRGRIEFEQGVDDSGRAWLECRDNGIGMGDRELNSVFAHAGMRFGDLPEFLEEKAAWTREGIEFYPNSRFGVGVLSYFMLGDVIEVSTSRFGRDGRVGPDLQVDIDGPGSLCRIRRVGFGEASGTTVRIYLRPEISVSCVDLLCRLLWVSEFSVIAKDGGLDAEWIPGSISARAPIGSEDPLAGTRGAGPNLADRTRNSNALSTSVPNLWWCSNLGGLLADGLWAGEVTFGRIVNLTGRLAPRLTVDRRRILVLDAERESALVRAAIPDLLSCERNILNPEWLEKISAHDVDLADAIAHEAMDHHTSWRVAGMIVDTNVVGCFPLDDEIFASNGYRRSDPALNLNLIEVAGWRLLSYVAAGLVPGLRCATPTHIPTARPSDAYLLSRPEGGRVEDGDWSGDLAEPVPGRQVISMAAQLGWSLAAVAARLQQLGAVVPEREWPQVVLTDNEWRLLSLDLDAPRPRRGRRTAPMSRGNWIDLAEPVPAAHVFRAAARLGWSAEAVAARLQQLGAVVPEREWPQVVLTDEDRRLLSRNLDGRNPWIDLAEPVPAAHVIGAAAQLGWSAEAVAARLQQLGAVVPEREWPQVVLTDDDRRLLSRGLDTPQGFYEPWNGPSDGDRWIDLTEPVPAAHVIGAAAQLGWSAEAVAARLQQLGAVVPEREWPQVVLTTDDRRLLSPNLDGRNPWIDLAEPVPAAHVIRAAAQLSWSAEAVAARLQQLGAVVPEREWPQVVSTDDDRRLLSRNLDSPQGFHNPWAGPPDRDRWIDLAEPVPVAHVIGAAARLGWSPETVAVRLRQLGAVAPELEWTEVVLTTDDRRLLSRGLDGQKPWIGLAEPVPAAHVFRSAANLSWSPAAVAARLRDFGMEVPDYPWPEIIMDVHDWQLISSDASISTREYTGRSLNRSRVFELSRTIKVGRLVRAVHGTNLTPAEAAQRLLQLGFEISAGIEVVTSDS